MNGDHLRKVHSLRACGMIENQSNFSGAYSSVTVSPQFGVINDQCELIKY